jgi:hypothetical protein
MWQKLCGYSVTISIISQTEIISCWKNQSIFSSNSTQHLIVSHRKHALKPQSYEPVYNQEIHDTKNNFTSFWMILYVNLFPKSSCWEKCLKDLPWLCTNRCWTHAVSSGILSYFNQQCPLYCQPLSSVWNLLTNLFTADLSEAFLHSNFIQNSTMNLNNSRNLVKCFH